MKTPTSTDLFDEFFAALGPIELPEDIQVIDSCCNQYDNQIVADEGSIVCSKCGTVVCDFLPVNPSDFEMVENYKYRNRYKPYEILSYQRKKIRYLSKHQLQGKIDFLEPVLKQCKNINQIKKTLRLYGYEKEYKNCYLYLPALPNWLVECIYYMIYHVKRYYMEHKLNKKKFFVATFLYRELTKLFSYWMPSLKEELLAIAECYFPPMKHRKTEDKNISVFISVLSEMNFTLLDKDMKRLLLTDPSYIEKIATKNTFNLDPFSANIELGRYELINAFEGYKLNETDRLNRLSNPMIPIRLQAPEEHALNVTEQSREPIVIKRHDDISSGPLVNSLGEDVIKRPSIEDGAETVPIKNIEVIDSDKVLPKNSLQSIQAKVEKFKELHSREIDHQKIVKKAKDLLNKYGSRNQNPISNPVAFTGSTANTHVTNPRE